MHKTEEIDISSTEGADRGVLLNMRYISMQTDVHGNIAC